MRSEFGEYMQDFPTQFFNAEVSDNELHSMALDLYNSVGNARQHRYEKSNLREHPERNMCYLIPEQKPDGSIYYIDGFTHNVVMSLFKNSKGLPVYYGPREMMTMLGGRNELGGIIKMIEDNDFFHDNARK
jgi:hypothetical protein